jgi:hypothetical protein
MGAFRNSWSTSFRVKGNTSLTLARIIEEAREAIPDVAGMNAEQISQRLVIIKYDPKANELLAGYHSNPG